VQPPQPHSVCRYLPTRSHVATQRNLPTPYNPTHPIPSHPLPLLLIPPWSDTIVNLTCKSNPPLPSQWIYVCMYVCMYVVRGGEGGTRVTFACDLVPITRFNRSVGGGVCVCGWMYGWVDVWMDGWMGGWWEWRTTIYLPTYECTQLVLSLLVPIRADSVERSAGARPTYVCTYIHTYIHTYIPLGAQESSPSP